MLTILNNYVHGYVAIPVIVACKEKGLFKILNSSEPTSFRDLVMKIPANTGYLRISLQMLEALNWVARNSQDEYMLTPASDIHHKIPQDIKKLMSFSFKPYLNKGQVKYSLGKWIELSGCRWDVEDSLFANFLDGVLIIPLILALKEKNMVNCSDNRQAVFAKINSVARKEIIRLFLNQGWLSQSTENGYLWTKTGQFMMDPNFIAAMAASCQPMLKNISQVIFGEGKSGFNRDLFHQKMQADWTLEVIGSGWQQEKYFFYLEKIVTFIFNRKPVAQQPKYIADMGCGDGTLLKKIYEIIKNKSIRGQVLNEYPIRLIGVDDNETALAAAFLQLKAIDPIVLKGDIGDPEKLAADLKDQGIDDVENILHVRSFLDHDRPYSPPSEASPVIEQRHCSSSIFCVDQNGNAIASFAVMQSLIGHFQRWRKILGKHGLIILEAHCLEPTVMNKFGDKCESLYFDAIHGFSQQLPAEADDFIMAAAIAGLFPNPDYFIRYPQNLPYSRITLNYFERRAYRARYAKEKDLSALEKLENKCWPPGLRASAATLKNRILKYPKGQLVLELDNQVVAAVYSQRIANIEDIKTVSMETVGKLHHHDGPIVQLLSLNVLPEMQHRNLGEQLLEFMLQRCSLMSGIHTVVGVTKCKDYYKHRQLTPLDYISLRNEHGKLVDTVLRLHELHGAQVKELVPNYRPGDNDNQGYGVLVRYDLYNRKLQDVGKRHERNIASANAKSQAKTVADFVMSAIRPLLGKNPEEEFNLDQPLMEMGLDSADLLELNDQIGNEYQISLEPAFFFTYNTAELIISYLKKHCIGSETGSGIEKDRDRGAAKLTAPDSYNGFNRTEVETRRLKPRPQDIAIIGAACLLPGGVKNIWQLWGLLINNRDAIVKKPSNRWDWPDNIDPEKEYRGIDLGGFLDEVDEFDAGFFRITPKEAEMMDPQQRILLELSWRCLEEAGIPAQRIFGSKTGVFIGASGSDYSILLNRYPQNIEAHYGIGTSMAALANRISYFYNLHGPSIQIDTACSSSLVAVAEAVKSLHEGKCAQALVGGINIICQPYNSISYYKVGMLSQEGKCKTFDKEANGYVRGEGGVMIFLKPLEKALNDRDAILAVIKGAAVNHGGQASGFTVPNPARQTDLLVEAYGTAGVKPETIGYIETHGTGTPLGDPIEVRGIKDAFSQLAELKEANSEAYCGLGSVKTNIGHLEAAAGIAGLLKVILCFKHQTLPASLNFHEINPSIYLDKTPFYIVTKNRHWDLPAGQSLRRAGVSSFGSGGTNAHVVLEESPVTYESSPKVFPYYLICLSAKNKTALQQREKDLLGWLDEEGRAESLADISATLLGGRDHFKLRASFVASSIQELKKKLQEVLKKGQAPGYLEGTAGQEGPESACRELARKTLAEIEANGQFDAKDYLRQLTVLAELYVKGYDWDDRAVPGGSTAARISLPAYPFAKERYWIPEPDRQSDVTDTALNLPVSRIHPLLHPNTADFCERQSSSILTGNVLLVPTWDPVLLQPKQNGPAPTTRVIIVGGTKANWEAIQQIYPRAQALEFDAQATIEAIEKKLDQGGPVEHIIWLVANPSLDSLADEALIEEQNQGVLLGLRMIKALLNLGYGTRDLGWTVITIQTQSLHGHEAANPTHVSLYGLLNSMAREYPNWKSRILDLEANCDWPIADIFGMPADLQGDAFIYRGRKWYRQSLIPARYPATGHTLYKSSGVYVVIGGAGGIGRLWSEYVIRTYQAQVIWIGRRPKDDVIQAKMDRLAALGPIPYYIAADATDLKALRRAYDEIKRRYAKINGVIHSAVGMLDQSLANMKEEHFKAGLSAKIDIGVRIVQVFQAEPLDFIMFFSSIVTFLKEYGKSSYVAGCSFSDAYARQLAREMPWAVKTINWGYWGGVGIASLVPAAFKNRLAQSGIGSIEPEEALQIMETVLAGSLNQIAVLKTTEPLALENLNIDEEISDYPKGISVNMEYIRKFLNEKSSVLKLEQPELRQPIREMEALLAKLLWTQLQSLGLFWKENMAIGDFKAKIGMCDRYSRWLDESIAVLTQNNYLKYHDASDTVSNHALLDVNAVWQEWDSQKALWVEDPDLKAKVILIEAMLKALPEILSGKLLATDVMFPNSSLELVEGVYTDNIVADYYNEVLANTVVAYVEERIKQDPTARIRIMEIGAGTGGTSVTVFQTLEAYKERIAEYCYTDISKAFLIHAEREYGRDNPYLSYRIFNVEKPVAGQDISAGAYDIVIATNVLHATKNIRQTIRNAKATLRKNGLLILNEICKNSLFHHLTFGLLEGWWLYEDPELRIPGCPGLSGDTWRTVLESEGFRAVFAPLRERKECGQQIIVAESDGVVRQKRRTQSKMTTLKTKATKRETPSETVQHSRRVKQTLEIGSGLLREKSIAFFKKLVGEVLKIPYSQIDASAPLEEYGIDSILVGQLNNALRKVFKDINSTLFFEYQTIEGLTEHFIRTQKEALMTLLGLDTPKPDEGVSGKDNLFESETGSPKPIFSREQFCKTHIFLKSDHPEYHQFHEPIAIIGISGRYPQAKTLGAYWDNLKTGKDCITEIPLERWPMDGFYEPDPVKAIAQGKSYCKHGGFIEGFADFDPLFFNISPREAYNMDPQERFFVESCWEVLEDAGYTKEQLATRFNGRVGVFVGVTKAGFNLYGPDLWKKGKTDFPHTSFSSIANRVSYLLNLKGPSMPFDTMCSSSLTAIHEACEHLYRGECEIAIAGGVNIYLHPSSFVYLCSLKMLSVEGRCKSFGKGADGFISGEGVGAILLKRLSGAVEDQDHIYAVIRATSINHGGKTNGYTVPNPVAQGEVVRAALDRAGVNSRTVSYVEAHGTGTDLGDPIEITGLTRAFNMDTQDTGFCAIGSVKSNIGHLESAAGIASVTKVVLQMQHRQLAPSLHAKELNPNIDFKRTPFVVQQELEEWKRPVIEFNGAKKEYPRIAAVSSFGAGGANAHVVLEEYIPERRAKALPAVPQVIVLSAKHKERLHRQAQGLLEAIGERHFSDLDLADIAYTLQIGREAMEERLGIIAKSLKELEEKLTGFVAERDGIEAVYYGQVKPNKETLAILEADEEIQATIGRWIERGKYSKILELWVKGLNFDWQRIHPGNKPSRISLPTYPFAEERYWLPESGKDAADGSFKTTVESSIHPLLHKNTSNLFEQRFTSVFKERGFFLTDHVVKGHSVLPGMAHLEMARIAVKQALGEFEDSAKALQLTGISWHHPIVVGAQALQVHIGLLPGNNDELLSYEVYGEATEANLEPFVYSEGTVMLNPAITGEILDLQSLRAQCRQGVLSSSECYEIFKTLGFQYGPGHRGIERLYVGPDRVLAKLCLPASVSDTLNQYVLHPSMMDGAIQATIALMKLVGDFNPKVPSGLVLPGFLKELNIVHRSASNMWALVKYGGGSGATEKARRFDVDLCDAQGHVCVQLKGLEMQEYLGRALGENVPDPKTQDPCELLTFEESWQEQALPEALSAAPKVIVCFLSNPDHQQAFARIIQTAERDCQVIFIAQDTRYQKLSQQGYLVDRKERATYEEALRSVGEDYGTADALLYMWAIEDSSCIRDYSCIFYLLQATASVPLKPKQLVLAAWFESALEQCYLESWIGFERSLGLVLPNTKIMTLLQKISQQNPNNPSNDWLPQIAAELQIPQTRSVLYQKGKRYIKTIHPITLPSGKSKIREGATYLITGGCGGLGFLFAEHIAKIQPVNLILTGRSELNEGQKSKIKRLTDSGSRIRYLQADVCDAERMKEELLKIKADFGTILGVIHAAGVRGGDGILERDVQDFIAVSDPKIKGTLLLDEILKEEDLEFICYFSSAAAILGDFGSCDYAVGNRFQMAYATYRHLLQLPGKAVAINWPLWRDGGMGFAEAETAKMYLKSSGQRYLEAEEGTLMFDRILAQDQTQCLVLAGQPGRVRRFLGLDGEPCPALAPAALGALGKGRRVEMKGLSLAQCVEWDLKEQISNLLKISREQLDIEENLADFGFDSISLAEFANALTNHYGIEITPALFFGYATIQKLTQYFLTQHQATLREFYREAVLSLAGLENVSSVTAYFKRQTGASRFRTTVRRQNPPEPIAIIGMSGRFPGTRNIDEMWQILFQGRDVIGEIPAERFDWRQYYGDPAKEPGKTNCKWCGCIPGVSEFDPMFFEISPREAISMDPRQRLLLQEAWNALEDAGYGAKQIRSGKMGMFVGVEEGDYHLLAPAKASITSNHNAILASRLAYFLDLDGPVMALNTTCSSGLVAAHQACLSLRNRECDTAIAAGVSLLLAPDSLINMAQAGMLSGDGKCYTFDRRANGMVPGEAVAVVVFKRLAQAESDGDPIYAIIQGSGVNYDGKTNGITAPSGGAQTKLLKSVYDQCRVNPEDIEYIVTHGTGTKLGDPVEINALYDAFKSYTEKRNYCALTSTKPNFGHAFAASGIVGLISLVQAFRYETIPASLHCERENTYINWQESPFYVNKTRQPWPERSGKTRTGAISAFGMNGTNVHMVLNSYPPKAGGAFHEPAPYYLLALSAKSKEALQEKVKAIVALLQIREWPEADLSRLSYTLLEGRQHFNFRCAVVFQGRDDVVYALTQVDKKEKLFNLFEGEVPRNFTGQKAMQEYLVDLIKQCRRMQNDREKYREKLYAVADLYRQGYEIPWDQMYERVKPCRMHLPTYPFTRDNYWVSKGKSPVYSSLESSGSHMRPASGGGELISAMACGKPREIGLTTVSAGLPPVSKPVEKVRQPITLTAVGADLASPQSVAEPETQPCLRPIITAEALREELSLSLADALFIERGAVDVDRKFIDLGLDSIIGVEWVRAINQQYGTAILATKVYDYPSVREFAGFMEKELAGLGAGLSPTARGCTPAPKRVEQARQPIALTATDVDLAPSQSVAEPETQPCLRPIITAEALREELSLSLADALFIERGAVDVDQKFIDMGLDSIIGVEWVRAINQQYGTAILATKVYDYPSVREFAGFMAKELAALGDGLTQRLFGPQDSGASQTRRVHSGEAGTENPKAQGPDLTPDARVLNQENSVRLPSIEAGLFQRKPLVSEEPPLKTADDKEAIAIIGMSGRYPDASNLEQYWNNLAQGKNAIREIPDSRWDVNQYYDPRPYQKGKIYCKWLGLLEDIDQFDPLFFNIAPTEAELMDPQHRLFLQEGYKAFEDAGYNCKALSNQKCGVYMGIMSHEYGLILYRNRIGGANTTGNSHAIGAARLPYFLNLKGPAIPIDTACSSSLVAIHLACRALLNREINMALAGGVSVYLTPEPYLGMCAAGMLSAAGQCKTFDNSADGFVPGEGAGTLLLKRLKDAEADRDLIHGVIIGSGINQDGKTNGITAPSVNSQSELEREIYSQNRIHPESISYVEMHGTGTKLGDPIELEALATVFKERTDRKQYCAIGSVKSNIGHTSAAAGMASVQKVLLCMKHQKLVPTLNFQNPNEHFDFENSPFYVNTELKPWEVSSGNSRRAGVNSLGFSGTNAHLVIEEYHPKPNCGAMPRVINQDNPILFVLSAQSEPQLKIYAKSMKSFIESHAGLNLADMAYTLQMGREEFEYRLAFPANSKETLLNALEGYIGNRPPAGVLVNRVKKNNKGVAFFESDEDVKVLLQNWIQKKKFKKLLELWVIGMSLDWNQLYQQAAPRRISLPTYPFAKERYWIPVNPANWKPNLSAAITEANPVTLNPANLGSVMLQKDWRGAVIPAATGVKTGVVVVLGTEATVKLALSLFEAMDTIQVIPVIHGGTQTTAFESITVDFYAVSSGENLYTRIKKAQKNRQLLGVIDITAYDGIYEQSLKLESGKIAFLQKMIEHERDQGCFLLQVTHQLNDFQVKTTTLQGARLVGLYRMLGAEYKQIHSMTMDSDYAAWDREKLARQIEKEFLSENEKSLTECCYRNGERYEPRLTVLQTNDELRKPLLMPKYEAEDVILITGGSRGIGAAIARHVISRGVRKLVIMGKEALPPPALWEKVLEQTGGTACTEKVQLLQSLIHQGVQVQYYNTSLTDPEGLKVMADKIRHELGPIKGVFHCAGLVSNNPAFIKKIPRDMEAVCEPKIAGLVSLHRTLATEPLNFFILFSSIAGVVPTLAAGQSDYSMANAYMDYYAQNQAKEGKSYFKSVQWPAWGETGMAMGKSQSPAYRKTGIVAHTTRDGLKLLDALMSTAYHVILPCITLPGEFTADLLKTGVGNENGPLAAPRGKKGFDQGMETPQIAGELPDLIVKWLQEVFGAELKVSAAQLEEDKPFDEYGVDSISMAQLTQVLQTMVSETIEPSLFWEYNTISALANYFLAHHAEALQAKLGAGATGRNNKNFQVDRALADLKSSQFMEEAVRTKSQLVKVSPTVATTTAEDIAIVGISCRFPGSPSKEAYWNLLTGGMSAIKPLAQPRWARRGNQVEYGGWLDDIDLFDPNFFNIQGNDAAVMDPQARIILEESLAAIYDSGYEHPQLSGQKVGVYIGGRSLAVANRNDILRAPNPILGMGQNYLAANISRFFNFNGPSMVVDTACSSGITGLSLAADSLRERRIDLALVGAVNLILTPLTHELFGARNILSKNGEFHIFDKRSNGEVLGEGAGIVILKRLSDASEDGNQIYGIIKAISVNNDGRTLGPGSPNLNAQKQVMQEALERCGKLPEDIGYIEVNGGGSPVIDSLEIKALSDIYALAHGGLQPCLIGSVKPNIGHLLLTSGLASFIRCVLSVYYQQIPPFLSALEPFDYYDFAASRIHFNRETVDWQAPYGKRRIAAQNSFPDGGTNCHVLIEEFVPPSGYQQRYYSKPVPKMLKKRFPLVPASSGAALPPVTGQSDGGAANNQQQPEQEPELTGRAVIKNVWGEIRW